jgi:hypothetical protein
VHGGSHGDLRENITSNTSAIGELRDTHAVREELPAAGPQRREHSAATQELEPQPVLSEPLGHIAAIDEEQLEHASRSGVASGERTSIEAPHDPAANVEDNDDSYSQPQPAAMDAERLRGQEREREVVSGGGASRRPCRHVQRGLRARRDPQSPRTHPEPGDRTSPRLHSGPAAERAGEPGAGDIDSQRPPARIPHRDDGGGRAAERDAKRARAELDAAAGRGTRDGCRGPQENQRCERASHRPMTV